MIEGDPFFDIVAAVLVFAGMGEIVASRMFVTENMPHARLVASLLFWEGLAMLVCAAIVYARRDFDMTTIVAFVAIWLAGAAIGAVRAGVFDQPGK